MAPKPRKGTGYGGARQGAGRKKGGRNRRTVIDVAEAREGGEMPLEYMLARMRDPQVPREERNDMAKAAAPYCHARLASTELKGDKDRPVVLEVLRDPKEGV